MLVENQAMKFMDRTLATPAENLACDEALLDLAEASGVEFLRVWESPHPFVVLGYGNRIPEEVNVQACAARGIPILRRCSGGGTVLQGPGCLSYAVCLQIAADSPLATISGTNRYIMEKTAGALRALLGRDVGVQGHTDLVVRVDGQWLKFSGNAQRRRRRAILFHGTILYHFNLKLIEELLLFPSLQPKYRADRGHLEFVTNITATREQIAQTLKHAWKAEVSGFPWPGDEIQALVQNRYGTPEWNQKRT